MLVVLLVDPAPKPPVLPKAGAALPDWLGVAVLPNAGVVVADWPGGLNIDDELVEPKLTDDVCVDPPNNDPCVPLVPPNTSNRQRDKYKLSWRYAKYNHTEMVTFIQFQQRQYLLTCKVSRYCLLLLHCSI